MGYLDMAPDHIGKWGPHHTSLELEVCHYVVHSLLPVILINFGCIDVTWFLLFQLPLKLVLQHRYAVDVLNPVVLGTMLHCLEHACHEIEILCSQDGNLVASV